MSGILLIELGFYSCGAWLFFALVLDDLPLPNRLLSALLWFTFPLWSLGGRL